GKPKGVTIPHHGVCNHMLWVQTVYPLTEIDCVLQKASLCFDASVLEIFWPLLSGARLIMARPIEHQDSAYLVKVIAKYKVTALVMVPSMLRMLLEEQEFGSCNCLRYVICAGEELPVELKECFFQHLDAELYNLYGQTETSIDVTFWSCKHHSELKIAPIGRPIANTQVYVLDAHLKLVPIGVPGELHIGGVGLGRGYLNRPKLTAEKFIPNPFSNEPGDRLYKTGDLARYLSDGNLEFLGRLDHQVKIRGFRVELGEVEAVLGQHPSVREVVVLAREDEPDDRRLVGYVVLDQKQNPTIDELRRFLKQKLPNYMIPVAFVMLDSLPLTPNGKIDRRGLPAPDQARPDLEVEFVTPRTPIEETLARIWTEVLGLEKIGVNDNFFELGGHSLLATQVMSRIRKIFRVELLLRYLFESPTVAEMSNVIIANEAKPGQTEKIALTLKKISSMSTEERKKILQARKKEKGNS
nr:non-ribosomal peptide synthetase [bacterium]